MKSHYIFGGVKIATAVALVTGLAACDSGPPPVLEVSSIAAPKNIATGGDALIKVVLLGSRLVGAESENGPSVDSGGR